MRGLCDLVRQRRVMEAARCDRVQRQIELVVPAELEARPRQLVVPLLCQGMTLHTTGQWPWYPHNSTRDRLCNRPGYCMLPRLSITRHHHQRDSHDRMTAEPPMLPAQPTIVRHALAMLTLARSAA